MPVTDIQARSTWSKAKQILYDAADTEAARFVESFGPSAQACASPIEELLMVALFAVSRHGCEEVHFRGADAVSEKAPCDETAWVHQQVSIGRYRADIVILDATLPFNLGEPRRMVVECDGHDFHERTKAQAQRDKSRDRFFQAKGYRVLRFTGSEIYADPIKCAEEIVGQFACNDCLAR